jgi:hypothetical protein
VVAIRAAYYKQLTGVGDPPRFRASFLLSQRKQLELQHLESFVI